MGTGYEFEATDLSVLILRRFYPERTDRESTVIRDFLLAHGHEYDRYEFSVRVGQGQTPDPTHLPGVQANTVRSTKKRIDLLFWRGEQPFIIEVKERVSPAVLGQLRTYRQLLLEDRPEIRIPMLKAIGRYSDDDTLRVLSAEGIEVLLYDAAEPS
jgi:hypothetical protein